MMKLPIPFEYNGTLISDCEVKRPNAEVMTATQRAAMNNFHAAFFVFTAGVIESLGGESDPSYIKAAVRKMPFKSGEVISIQALLMVNEDDMVEGVYTCPRCGDKVFSELTEDYDGRDSITKLKIKYVNKIENEIVTLVNPITLRTDTEELIVEEIGFHHPTYEDCMNSMNNNEQDRISENLAIWVQAIDRVNKLPLTYKGWKGDFGMKLMKGLSIPDMKAINAVMGKYGIDNMVKKTCKSCKKVFDVPVNTASFFASGLQAI